jgi:hypothetical protein
MMRVQSMRVRAAPDFTDARPLELAAFDGGSDGYAGANFCGMTRLPSTHGGIVEFAGSSRLCAGSATRSLPFEIAQTEFAAFRAGGFDIRPVDRATPCIVAALADPGALAVANLGHELDRDGVLAATAGGTRNRRLRFVRAGLSGHGCLNEKRLPVVTPAASSRG